MPARELAGQGVVGVKSGGEGTVATLVAPLAVTRLTQCWRTKNIRIQSGVAF